MATNPIADLAAQVALLTTTNAALVAAANDAIALANDLMVNAATKSALAADTGAGLVGTLADGTVQEALDDRPTETELAAAATVPLMAFTAAEGQSIFDNALPMASYAALRAYTGRAVGFRLTAPDIAGHWYVDASDTTSPDDNGTVLVRVDGKRVKRLFVGIVTSIAAAPPFLPCFAYVGGIGYLAVGTSSAADWKRIALASIATITTTATLTAASESTQLANAASGAIVVNLPAAASAAGQVFNIKKIDSSANTVTIDPNGAETIDGAATSVLTAQYQSLQIQSNGSAWYIL